MSKVESNYPILIKQMFPDLPKTVKEIDAAYERLDGMIVLFTGIVNTEFKMWIYLFEFCYSFTFLQLSFTQVFIATGDKYWVYDGKRFIENSPRPISDYGLPNNLDSIDAVQVWTRNG